MSKNKGGRPKHIPTDALRTRVETLSGMGTPISDIAILCKMAEVTLRKHYKSELDGGGAKATAAVAGALYSLATSTRAGAGSAQQFWMKTRAGWKEKSAVEITGKDGGDLRIYNYVGVESSL